MVKFYSKRIQNIFLILFKEKKKTNKTEKGVETIQNLRKKCKKSLIDKLHIIFLDLVVKVTKLKHTRCTFKQLDCKEVQ